MSEHAHGRMVRRPDAGVHAVARVPWHWMVLGGPHAVYEKADSDQQMAVLVRRYADDNAFTIGETYAYRGQSDQALQWLERAKVQKDAGLYFINASILFKKLAPDARFRTFLRKMNLPE